MTAFLNMILNKTRLLGYTGATVFFEGGKDGLETDWRSRPQEEDMKVSTAEELLTYLS